MAIELAAEIPCVELKPLGDIPEIKLLGGVDLKAFIDITGGPPTDCKLTFNLMIQLAPLLASMACLFKILNVISKISDFANAFPNMSNAVKAASDLVKAIDELKGCIPAFAVPQLMVMLKMMLQLVLQFLSCFLSQLHSILEFRGSLDFAAAEGNPVLTEALTCAGNSADAAQVNLLKALEPLMPVMNITGMVGGIVGIPVEIPDFAAMSAGGDVNESIGSVQKAIGTLQKVIDSIPG
jgi:hypothetical protein